MNPLEAIWGRFYWKWLLPVVAFLSLFHVARALSVSPSHSVWGAIENMYIVVWGVILTLHSPYSNPRGPLYGVSRWLPDFSRTAANSLFHFSAAFSLTIVVLSLTIVVLFWIFGSIPNSALAFLLVISINQSLALATVILHPILKFVLLFACFYSGHLLLDNDLNKTLSSQFFSGLSGIGILLASVLITCLTYLHIKTGGLIKKLPNKTKRSFSLPIMENLFISACTSARRARVLGEIFAVAPYLFVWWTYLFIPIAALLILAQLHFAYLSIVAGPALLLCSLSAIITDDGKSHGDALNRPDSRAVVLRDRLFSTFIICLVQSCILLALYLTCMILGNIFGVEIPRSSILASFLPFFLTPAARLLCLIFSLDQSPQKFRKGNESIMPCSPLVLCYEFLTKSLLLSALCVVVVWSVYVSFLGDDLFITVINAAFAWLLYSYSTSYVLTKKDLWLSRGASHGKFAIFVLFGSLIFLVLIVFAPIPPGLNKVKNLTTSDRQHGCATEQVSQKNSDLSRNYEKPAWSTAIPGSPASAPAELRKKICESGDSAEDVSKDYPTGIDCGDLRRAYTGGIISIDLAETPLSNAFGILSEVVSGLEFKLSEDVRGEVNLRLIDVEWDHALDVILKTHSLGQYVENGVIHILPIDQLEEKRRALIADQKEEQKPPALAANEETGDK